MGNFKPGGNRGFGGKTGGSRFGGGAGGRSSFGRKPFGGGSFEKRDPIMHKTVCGECGKPCEVPFRPTQGKPVFCKDCFAAQGGLVSSRPSRERSERPSYGDRSERPAYAPRGEAPASADTAKALEAINVKLDRLIKAIETLTQE